MDDIQSLREKYYNATVSRIVEKERGLWILRIKPDGEMLDFKPGQYITLGLGYWEERLSDVPHDNPPPEKLTKMLRRAYSLSHPVLNDKKELIKHGDLDFYEFYLTIVKNSDKPAAFTPRLFNLKEGDRLEIGKKFTGHYTLEGIDQNPETNFLFLATGTGEAPHNAMTWELLQSNFKGPILNVVCTRYQKDQGYKELHEKIAKRFSNYQHLLFSTRDESEKIYIQELLKKNGELLKEKKGFNLDVAKTHIFLCGNPSMIGLPKITEEGKSYPEVTGCIEILESIGFTMNRPKAKGNIHFESYW